MVSLYKGNYTIDNLTKVIKFNVVKIINNGDEI